MNSSVGEIIRNVVLAKSAASFNSNSIENAKEKNRHNNKPSSRTDIADRKKQWKSRPDDNSRKEVTETLSDRKSERVQDDTLHSRTDIANHKRKFESRQDDKNLRKKATKTSLKRISKKVQNAKWRPKTPEERSEIKRSRNRKQRHRKTMERQNKLQKEMSLESQDATETDLEKKQKNTQDDDKPCKTLIDADLVKKQKNTHNDDDKPCKTVTDADLERRREKKRLKNRLQRKRRVREKYNLPKELSPETQKATEADLEKKLENGDDKPRRKATKADLERKREKSRLNQKLKREKRKNKKLLPESRKFAIDYLNLWHSSRSQWAFKTKQQHWLLRHIFDPNNISEEEFAILLQYILSLQGIAKSRLIEQSEKIISMEEHKIRNCTVEIPKSKEEASDATKTTDETEAENINSTVVERARQILQILV